LAPVKPPDLEALLQAGYRYAVTLCRDPEAAQDLVQEAALGVVRAGREFSKPYLFAAVRNRYIDQHRRSRLLVLEPSDELDPPEPGPDPERLAVDRDTLERAFAELREPEREALYLTAVEGYSAREVGELTGRPRNTVLSLLHRSRAKRKKLLERDAGAAAPGEEVAS